MLLLTSMIFAGGQQQYIALDAHNDGAEAVDREAPPIDKNVPSPLKTATFAMG